MLVGNSASPSTRSHSPTSSSGTQASRRRRRRPSHVRRRAPRRSRGSRSGSSSSMRSTQPAGSPHTLQAGLLGQLHHRLGRRLPSAGRPPGSTTTRRRLVTAAHEEQAAASSTATVPTQTVGPFQRLVHGERPCRRAHGLEEVLRLPVAGQDDGVDAGGAPGHGCAVACSTSSSPRRPLGRPAP